MKLRVIQPFQTYKTGDDIADPVKIKEIIDSDHASFVVKVGDTLPNVQADTLPTK
jgi:hypothetical protein